MQWVFAKVELGRGIVYLHGAYHGAQGEHGGRVPQRGLAVERALRVHQQHGDLREEDAGIFLITFFDIVTFLNIFHWFPRE